MSTHLSTTTKSRIDRMPFDRADLANLTPDQRTAIYTNQIRKMMVFFVVLAGAAVLAAVILGILDISAVHSLQQTSPLGD